MTGEMWIDLILRFFLGGVMVSLFALLGDLFKPKSFAGLFSAAPSIALASLGLAMAQHGGAYASVEGRSMVGGAIAFYVYSQLVSWLLMRYKLRAALVSAAAMILWLASAFGIWFVVLK